MNKNKSFSNPFFIIIPLVICFVVAFFILNEYPFKGTVVVERISFLDNYRSEIKYKEKFFVGESAPHTYYTTHAWVETKNILENHTYPETIFSHPGSSEYPQFLEMEIVKIQYFEMDFSNATRVAQIDYQPVDTQYFHIPVETILINESFAKEYSVGQKNWFKGVYGSGYQLVEDSAYHAHMSWNQMDSW